MAYKTPTFKIRRVFMESMCLYRHENKYICSAQELVLAESRLKSLMAPDSHTNEEGIYQIRSLYFDDYSNTCYYENENGTDPREKFRIRIYNGDASHIRLELKKKNSGKTLKLSCKLTEEQCSELMAGRALPVTNSNPPVLNKLLLQMKTKLMRPKVIVEYSRTPFIYERGNVRVTFDRNISSSSAYNSFLDSKIAVRPIMPASFHILEVKYDEYMPDFIYKNLQLQNLELTTFSKYYLCRKFSL